MCGVAAYAEQRTYVRRLVAVSSPRTQFRSRSRFSSLISLNVLDLFIVLVPLFDPLSSTHPIHILFLSPTTGPGCDWAQSLAATSWRSNVATAQTILAQSNFTRYSYLNRPTKLGFFVVRDTLLEVENDTYAGELARAV